MMNVNGHLTQGHWGWIEKEQIVVIEAAEGAGLIYANSETLHPKNHISYGIGEQILQVLDKGTMIDRFKAVKSFMRFNSISLTIELNVSKRNFYLLHKYITYEAL